MNLPSTPVHQMQATNDPRLEMKRKDKRRGRHRYDHSYTPASPFPTTASSLRCSHYLSHAPLSLDASRFFLSALSAQKHRDPLVFLFRNFRLFVPVPFCGMGGRRVFVVIPFFVVLFDCCVAV